MLSASGIQLAIMPAELKGFQMIRLIMALAILVASVAQADNGCTKMCDPAKSRPCGRSCINKDLNCKYDWATTCSGVKEDQKQGFSADQVKHVDKAPGK